MGYVFVVVVVVVMVIFCQEIYVEGGGYYCFLECFFLIDENLVQLKLFCVDKVFWGNDEMLLNVCF